MPISCPISPRPIAQEEFARLDYQVMGLAFESQNELGRLCDEIIYQTDLADRIRATGVGSVHKEVPLIVSHRSFVKTYSMDIVLGDAAVYEFKTARKFILEHDAQLLNYLLMWGAQHGKLLNFRTGQVESRFVNTTLTAESQRQFQADLRRWRGDDEASEKLRETLLGILNDWGVFLELPLYLEALVHFLGGEENVLRLVPLHRDGIFLGKQRLHLVSSNSAFRLTAMAGKTDEYEHQLSSLLRHSPLRAIHWINLAHHQIQFVTLRK